MKREILLIDDDRIILKTLSKILLNHNIEIDTESDPQIALEKYAQNPCNIVLTDMQMPGMDGIEVIQRIKNVNPLCNVIVLTAYSTMGRVIECIELGACDYVTKPISDIPLFLEIIQSASRRVQRWRTLFGMRGNNKE